jgi:hypothetical protein
VFKTHLLFALLVMPTLATAQVPDQSKRKDALARQWILDLRNGVLLVRLQSRSNALKTIRERGLEEKAKEIEGELRAENESIRNAFRDHYEFSEVYFFGSDDSGALKERNFDDVSIFDANSDPVTIDLSTRKFFVAEFGKVRADTADYKSTPDPGFGALIIMSDQFIQLDKPFPYYVRTFETLPILKRSHDQVVRKMNQKLFGFY